ncbi:sensor domain-containing diguanylate cyclase [Pseudomonas sp. GOM7]|uniref:sensor domain-containing diguanylate cyclase n=1 Tax=Pseudomonas sp. GOM7 TaxID=2998079 RepID=UPI00227B43CD|nr:diguanylate cyclase [Pseudomonas sp. GOM7]WAJ35822.1 sensor domain-containing diguanylate cyclase [Pseudomonas sp. GOM7]
MTATLRLLMLLLLPALTWAKSLPLPADHTQMLPGPYMFVWKDPNGQADFKQVSTLPDSAWQAVGRRDASFGYGGNAYWLRLDVHNPHDRSLDWILVIGNPLLDQLDAYGLDGERIYRAGDQRPFAWRWLEHRQLLLPLRVEPGEQQRIWLRMQTAGSANLSASLMTHATFNHQEQLNLLLQGLFFGALIAMLIYNLSIFCITRDRNYLWYSLFVASFSLYQFIQLGFAQQWLWPNALAWQQLSFPFMSALATLFGIHFTYGVLELDKAPKAYRWTTQALKACCWLVLGMALFGPYTPALFGSFALLIACAPVAFIITLLRWREGYTAARLFALGWFVLITASLASILTGTGLLPYSLLTLHAQQMGGLIEMTVFSIALAARIRQAQQAKRQAQAKLIEQERRLGLEQAKRLELQQQISENLEQRVQERTATLQDTLQQLSQANQRLAELNRHDGLTGLLNRQTLSEELTRACFRAMRSQQPLAVLMLDLDHFKQVNDRHGHLAGDACLRHAAQRIRQRLRSSDWLARFGGEEFVALLDSTDMTGALDLAEQLREDLASNPCPYQQQSIPLSLSIGLHAGTPSTPACGEHWLDLADRALYRAKAGGRNRVACYEEQALDNA